MKSKALKIKEEVIAEKIQFVRGEKVLIDRDLATLYGIETKVLKQAGQKKSEKISRRFYVCTY